MGSRVIYEALFECGNSGHDAFWVDLIRKSGTLAPLDNADLLCPSCPRGDRQLFQVTNPRRKVQ